MATLGFKELNENLLSIQKDFNKRILEIEEDESGLLSVSDRKSLIDDLKRQCVNIRITEISKKSYDIEPEKRRSLIEDEKNSFALEGLMFNYMKEINNPLLSAEEKKKLQREWDEILKNPSEYVNRRFAKGELLRMAIQYPIFAAVYCLLCWGTGWYFDFTFIQSFGWSVQHETLMWCAFIPVVNILTIAWSAICWAFVFWVTVGATLLWKIGILSHWNIFNLFGW